jgi:hypothetical protein
MKNMLKKPADSVSSSSMDDDSGGQEEGKQNSINDAELGFVATGDSAQTRSPLADDKDDSEYTHVLILRPGCAIADRHVKVLEDCRMEIEKKTRRSSRSRKIIYPVSKVGQETQGINNGERVRGEEDVSCTKDEAGEVNGLVDEALIEERAVPIFCAVCLTEYEISHRVCWSSNSECSHIFHEDCMLRWLVALGREHSRRKRFSTNPSERKLLDFEMICPCCRQNFISMNEILGTEESV